MTTKEFATAFDMTVNEMCQFTGYSRDGLNEIVQGRSTKPGTKKKEANHSLRDLADDLHQKEIKAAHDKYEQRKESVRKLFGLF